MYMLILCSDSAGCIACIAGCIAWTQSGLSFRPPGFNPYIGWEESKVYGTWLQTLAFFFERTEITEALWIFFSGEA